jgi:ribosome-binding factor A
MKPHRNLQIASVIEHELSQLLLRECDFGNALVTITRVEVGEKLLQAVIHLSIIPYEKGLGVFEELGRRRKELEYKLLKKTRLRMVPRLEFKIEENKAP